MGAGRGRVGRGRVGRVGHSGIRHGSGGRKFRTLFVAAVKRLAVPANSIDLWLPHHSLQLPQPTAYPIELGTAQAVTAEEWTRDFVPLFQRIEAKRYSLVIRFSLLLALIPLTIFAAAGGSLLARGSANPAMGPPPSGIMLLVIGIPFSIVFAVIFSRFCAYKRLPGFVAKEVQALAASQPGYAARGVRFEMYSEEVALLHATKLGRVETRSTLLHMLRVTCPRNVRPPMSWATHGTLPLAVQLRFEAITARAFDPSAAGSAEAAAASAPGDARGSKIWTSIGLLEVPPHCVPSAANDFVLVSPLDYSSPLPLPPTIFGGPGGDGVIPGADAIVGGILELMSATGAASASVGNGVLAVAVAPGYGAPVAFAAAPGYGAAPSSSSAGFAYANVPGFSEAAPSAPPGLSQPQLASPYPNVAFAAQIPGPAVGANNMDPEDPAIKSDQAAGTAAAGASAGASAGFNERMAL